jgi:DNA-binding LacI/PurR family transcriptional regulator
VEVAAAALNYRPNRAARGLRLRHSLTVGVLIPDIQNVFFTGIVRGLEHVLREQGYTYLLANSDGRTDRERLYLDTLRDEGVAGFLVVPSENDPRRYRELQAAGVPLVLLDRAAPGLRADQVAVANQEGAHAAVRHLIELGHRRIGYIGGPVAVNVARERRAGYREALEEAGIRGDPGLERAADFQQSGGRLAATELMSRAAPPTALFVANNLMTIGALEVLHERQLRIPEDIAIIGFDDMPWATCFRPPLSVVAQPTFELGAAAARLLLDRLREPSRPYRRVVLETRLLNRGSEGPPLRPGRSKA